DVAAQRDINDVVLWEGSIPSGGTAELTIIVAEEDWASSETDALKAAQELAKSTQIDDPIIGPIVKLFALFGGFLANKDDYIGSVAIRIRNNNGTLVPEWRPLDDTDFVGITAHTCVPEFRLHKDGTYRIWIDFKQDGNWIRPLPTAAPSCRANPEP